MEQLRVHANVFNGKGSPVIEKQLLLIPHSGNERRERLVQVGFIESCLTGAQRSRDNKQCWSLLAQGVIPSCAVFLCGPCWDACSMFCIESRDGVSLSV